MMTSSPLSRLASLEAGERDAAEFTHWQEEMKQVCCVYTQSLVVCEL